MNGQAEDMAVATLIDVRTTALVGMGDTVSLRDSEAARSVVGSCAGLMIYHLRLKVAAVAHIVLPEAVGRSGVPGKFADTAIPYMVDLLRKLGAERASLVAKVAGGAQMFGATGPLRIGDANVHAVTAILSELRIPLQGKSVGGAKGRKLTFHCDSGEITVDIAGEESFVI
jgi:chemotaxis protein CheD